MHRASAKGYEDTKVVGPEELPFVRQMVAPGTRIFAWVDPARAVPHCWYLAGSKNTEASQTDRVTNLGLALTLYLLCRV